MVQYHNEYLPPKKAIRQPHKAGELPPLKWSSLKYDFVGGLFDGEEAYG
jgi:hypothetical protein